MSAADDLLDELVFQVLERRDSGDAAALDELCHGHPERASELRRRVAALESSGMLAVGGPMPDQLGEFRLIRRLGQGGMGVVFLAEQAALGRRVAVKVVRPEQLFFRGARERFRREVEAVARLAHPGIVPVYTFGEHAGMPYYAMELVEGASVDEVLTRLRGRDPARLAGEHMRDAVRALCVERGFAPGDAGAGEPLFAATWRDACVWLVRDVAQALEHAHQRGVLHRDVKPSNVLLTPAGRVMLVDFGLASTEGAHRITQSGAQVGSLAYMAPEQVAADAERVGPRTDVYALGALLYEMLTLHLPFEERDAAALAQRIAAGHPVRLRRLNSALGADDETVCLTALEVEPERRYASAAHFARDLSNLLQHRPIEARPLGAWIALRRWSQRRPALATALGLGALAVLGGPLVYGLQEARAGRKLAVERDIARTNLDAALDAVESLLERVGHRDLRDVPRVDELRKELLERASALYARLEASASDDARVRLRAGSALGKLARLRRETGDNAGALRDFEAAEAHLRALAAERPDDPETLFEFGNLLCFAAIARHGTQAKEALEALEPAVALLRRAVALDPGRHRARSELTRVLLGVAHFLHATGAKEASRATYAEARELATALRAEDPRESDALELWATATSRIASMDMVALRNEEAERAFERVLAETTGAERPSSYLRQVRSLSTQMLGRIRGGREGAERDPEIDNLLAAAHADFEALTRDFPRNDGYADILGTSWVGLGDRALRYGELDTARRHFEEALRVHSAVADSAAGDARYRRNVGLAESRLTTVERTLGNSLEAAAHAGAAVAAHVRALELSGRIESRDELIDALRVTIALRLELGDARAAADATRRMSAATLDPFAAELDAARGLASAAQVAGEKGEPELAAELRLETLARLERALAADPTRAALVAQGIAEWGLAADADFSAIKQRAESPR